MAKPEKVEAVLEYKEKLENNGNFILTTYSGLTVEEITKLRGKLRAINSEMKVISNNLFLRALKDSSEHKDKQVEFAEDVYFGPLAAVFSREDLPAAAKICKDFGKDNENLVMKTGYMDGQVLSDKEVQAIAGLPSKQELLAQIAGGLNGPARSIATGINQIMASLARAINAVAEKNNN